MNKGIYKDPLTGDEKIYYNERMTESPTGKVIIPSYLLKKYRKRKNDYISSNDFMKAELIKEVWL